MQAPLASVIICTRNRRQDLLQCLPSLAAQTYRSFELIIVDSSDVPVIEDDICMQAIDQFKPNCVYIHSAPGLTLQRNKGINAAASDIIYFFDDDVVLEPNYLEVMQHVFAQHSEYVGGMGSIINMQPPLSYMWRLYHQFFLLQRDYSAGTFTLSGMPTHAYGNVQFKHIEVLGGCCMAFRKSVLNKHRFDEKLERYAYMEDADISWRVSQEGPLFYNPHARLSHHASPVARDAAIDNRAMFIRNYRYLFFKNVYPHNRLRIVAYWWTIVGLYLKALLLRDTTSVKGYLKAIRYTLR